MAAEKGKKVSQLKQSTESNSLEAGKNLEGFAKAPGQTGLAAPHSLDAIRKPKPDQRVDKGERVFGGVSEPKRVDQTDDLYVPPGKAMSDKTTPKKKP
jgi:hypothetical protein